jgi:CheY-like chemotaxis protein
MPAAQPVILIIEDTLEFARLTQMMLKRFGYESHHAADGEAAVEFCASQKPDVVLMDLNLPGMSGWQVLEQMALMFGEGTIPVIITSAYSDSANRTVGKLQGVYKYLVKPINPQSLVGTVEEALGIERKA